jgi:hypothetical protein
LAIEDAVLALEGGVYGILGETGALTQCPAHPEIFIRVGDHDKERRAYALAANRLKSSELSWDERQEVMEAIKDCLDSAADGICPVCEAIARS